MPRKFQSDSLRQAARSITWTPCKNRPVYDLGFISFTYKEVKEKEINLGLDLKGGMNVMLEVQVEDVLKALAGDSAHDPMFEEAIARANKALKEGTNNYIGEFAKAYREVSGGAPLAALFVSPDRKDITPNSSDSEVEKILQEETDAAIDASFNILRSRIDHFRRYAAQHPAPAQFAPYSGRAAGREGAGARTQAVAGYRFARVLDDL